MNYKMFKILVSFFSYSFKRVFLKTIPFPHLFATEIVPSIKIINDTPEYN